MPAYNGASVIEKTIHHILSQSFTNFELIIVDDNSKDNTLKVIAGIKDSRIRLISNKVNMGYPGNLERCRQEAAGDIIYLMGQDDILGKDALLNTYNAFKFSDDIGAVTRPYFWFDKEIKNAVRAKSQYNKDKDTVISIQDGERAVIEVFKTLDQLSGLAYRRKYMDLPFHEDIFPCHVYPFASIFKKHKIVFLKDYNIAVRIDSSQTRSVSSIYEKSPILSWINMFETVFHEKEFQEIREKCINNFVMVNYVGLVQIRNYAEYKYLLREIFYLIRYRKQNLFSIQFWFFSLGTMLMPASLLIPLVDFYKNHINLKLLKDIKFDYGV